MINLLKKHLNIRIIILERGFASYFHKRGYEKKSRTWIAVLLLLYLEWNTTVSIFVVAFSEYFRL